MRASVYDFDWFLKYYIPNPRGVENTIAQIDKIVAEIELEEIPRASQAKQQAIEDASQASIDSHRARLLALDSYTDNHQRGKIIARPYFVREQDVGTPRSRELDNAKIDFDYYKRQRQRFEEWLIRNS